MFQSHAGSIEARPLPNVAIVIDTSFQSHAGSIEADDLSDSGDQPAPSFNPTLVRLRPIHPR